MKNEYSLISEIMLNLNKASKQGFSVSIDRITLGRHKIQLFRIKERNMSEFVSEKILRNNYLKSIYF
jgi:predicted ABC-type ATPase